jgi:hypothetical protein
MTQTRGVDSPVGELASRLFVPQERLGWEFVEPAPAARSPLLSQEPQWLEPSPPDLRELQAQHRRAKDKLPKACALIAVVFLFGIALPSTLAVLAALVMGGVWIAPVISLSSQMTAAQGRAEHERHARRAAYEQAHSEWQRAISAQDSAEQKRLTEAMHWFPLDLRAATGRVDVFGGSGNGRAVLFATMGASLIAAGNRVTLLDFTEESIGHPLSVLMHEWGGPVTTIELPEDLAVLDLLAGLSVQDAAELLASAVHSDRGGDDHNDRRDLAADLLVAVLSRLDEQPIVARLVAGLRTLNNTYDLRTESALADEEVARLVTASHDLVIGERVKDELRSLISRLQLLVPSGRPDPRQSGSPFAPFEGTGLTIYSTTAAESERQKELLDRLLVALSIRAIRLGIGDGTAPVVLVVAGADNLDKSTLESLARHARNSGTRLVYMFDHLRDDARVLLGGPHSASVLMQLGNAEEAAAAATFLGRGHRFVLSQVSRQQGTTTTVGGGTSVTEQASESVTEGVNRGGSRQGSNWGTQKSRTESESMSWSTNTSWSLADSRTDGQIDARVYEFTVEPTEIQALPPTAFALVDNTDGHRRIAMGNCDPRISELDRVATQPR